MSKGIENNPDIQRSSLTGSFSSQRMWELKNVLPSKTQLVRAKDLLEEFGSDEEESEDKESDSQSDCDDIQQLPDDNERDKSLLADDSPEKIVDDACVDEKKFVDEKLIEKIKLQPRSPLEQENISPAETTSESQKFTDNFKTYEKSQVKYENQKPTSLSSESAYNASSLASKPIAEISSRSNPKFRAPDLVYSSNTKQSYSSLSSKSESSSHYSYSSGNPKTEQPDLPYYSNERRSHETNPVPQAEPHVSSAAPVALGSTTSHQILDTPLKNNPPPGSTRPNPSTSHRSMFQTPQSSKFNPQDYGKNHVQTPATIFSNWSGRNMSHTPLENRSAIQTGDSARGSSILSTALSSSHEIHGYRSSTEKKVRRPLAETMRSSINHPQHSLGEKPQIQYSTDPSSTKHRESLDDKIHILESAKGKSSNNIVEQHPGYLGSKENLNPPVSVEKLPIKEENRGSRATLERIKESAIFSGSTYNDKRSEANEEARGKQGNFERIKESISIGNPGNSSNDNRIEATRQKVDNSDAASSRNVRSNATTIDKNNVGSAKKANVQLSIPSTIRKSNQGETIRVKNKSYLVLGTLGQGMSGRVLRVQDLATLELRAIKVVELIGMEKECAQGCLEEISMLYKLQAPCIVKIFDYEIHYPIIRVVMEMGDTDFRNFLNSLTEKKQLPLTMILYYWTEMLTAVKHIHDNNVIHSDLKPANFLLVRGRLKLIDFGIASNINADMTSVVKNSTLGTLNYISPEAFMDVGGNGGDSPNHRVKYKISFKSDVWSLGCILYGLVYGYTPFHNFRTQWTKMQAIMNPNTQISFTIPGGKDVEQPPPILIDVMRKCLQHDPKARPSVEQLLQIAYIPTKPNPRISVPVIPSNIVMKIKQTLNDDEWRQFKEVMEARSNQS